MLQEGKPRFARSLCVVFAAGLAACGPVSRETDSAEPSPTPLPEIRATPEPAPTPTPVPTPTPEPEPTPLPQVFIPYQELEISRIFNGVRLRSELSTEKGGIASVERRDPTGYTVDVNVRVRVPEASTTLEQLSSVNPDLPKVLPGLETMLPTAKVSDFFHGLYDLKVRYLHDRIKRLDQIVSVHNFYDTETILELQHPETGRRALLMQSEMDVVTDGSDGDRQGEIDTTSASFQPFTSYKWRKKGPTPNPFLEPRKKKLAELEKEFAVPGLSIDRNRELREGIERLKIQIRELETYSFLVATADPFVVLPGFIRRQTGHAFKPELGDYAAVIYGDTIYPAIFGDVGPSYKAGEASLRICREIEPKASGIRRAVNDLKVTYLVFPGSADPEMSPPDLKRWIARVKELLAEIGGNGGTIREWEDLLAKPEPTPPESPAVPNADMPPVTTPLPGLTPPTTP